MLKRPAEAGQVGGAQTQLALPFNQVQLCGKLLLEPLRDGGGTVGRTVIDDQHVIITLQGADRPDDVFDILLLVVGWDDDDFLVHSTS